MFTDILEMPRKLARLRRVCPRAGQWAGHLAVLTAMLACSGCVSRMAANRLIAAPNVEFQKNETAWQLAWTNFLALVTTNQMLSLDVPVGPPDATISVLEVPPGEYHR